MCVSKTMEDNAAAWAERERKGLRGGRKVTQSVKHLRPTHPTRYNRQQTNPNEMNAKLLSLTVLAVLAATSAVAVVEASPGTLSKDSPLYPILQQATDSFKCEGNACIFTLSDQTGENGTCVPPKVPRIPGNRSPTVEEFCAYHQSNPAELWHSYA